MSFLTPLYALGALAIAAPIVFHLIRRTPSGEVPFSSLMFLKPSPPRLSKRSRLDQRSLPPIEYDSSSRYYADRKHNLANSHQHCRNLGRDHAGNIFRIVGAR